MIGYLAVFMTIDWLDEKSSQLEIRPCYGGHCRINKRKKKAAIQNYRAAYNVDMGLNPKTPAKGMRSRAHSCKTTSFSFMDQVNA